MHMHELQASFFIKKKKNWKRFTKVSLEIYLSIFNKGKLREREREREREENWKGHRSIT